MSDYQRVFKSSPTLKLLQIVDQASDYSQEAVEFAKAELSGRSDLKEWLDHHNNEKALTAIENAKKEKVENVIRKKVDSILTQINPFQEGSPSGEVRINWLLIFFVIILIIHIVKEAPYHMYLVSEDKMNLNLYTFIDLLPFIIIPLGSILLYKKKKHGWGILYAWSIINCSGSIIGAINMWGFEPSGILALDLMMYETSFNQYLMAALLVATIIIALLSNPVRETLVIDQKTILLWTAVGILGPFIFFPF